MADITGADLELLREHASERNGLWAFGPDLLYVHEPRSAAAIVRACLALDVPVTDQLTGEAWNKVVMKIATLEARVSELEGRPSPG